MVVEAVVVGVAEGVTDDAMVLGATRQRGLLACHGCLAGRFTGSLTFSLQSLVLRNLRERGGWLGWRRGRLSSEPGVSGDADSGHFHPSVGSTSLSDLLGVIRLIPEALIACSTSQSTLTP